ncbi:hypothetical protein J6590_093927, partial [Homalodisca vitripennis]
MFTLGYECLVPNVPNNSVVVMHNASYHNKEDDENTKQCDIQDWLSRHGIEIAPTMYEVHLLVLPSQALLVTMITRKIRALETEEMQERERVNFEASLCNEDEAEHEFASLKNKILALEESQKQISTSSHNTQFMFPKSTARCQILTSSEVELAKEARFDPFSTNESICKSVVILAVHATNSPKKTSREMATN